MKATLKSFVGAMIAFDVFFVIVVLLAYYHGARPGRSPLAVVAAVAVLLGAWWATYTAMVRPSAGSSREERRMLYRRAHRINSAVVLTATAIWFIVRYLFPGMWQK